MNTPADHDHDDLRYAEYVLGVLDADTRAAVEREILDNPQAAAAVALWQRHLLPLSEDIPAVAPADYVWVRLQSSLGLTRDIPAPALPRQRLWDSLPLWRWMGIGASVLAAACLVMLFTTPRPSPPNVNAHYMVSSIQQDNGITGWTAAMDIQHAQMVVVPATPAAIAGDRSPELWLIPPGGKPIALGVIARDKPTTVKLRPDLLANLSAKALLAVSVEPAGGSPTGQPTGPVVAKGAISGT